MGSEVCEYIIDIIMTIISGFYLEEIFWGGEYFVGGSLRRVQSTSHRLKGGSRGPPLENFLF